MRKIIVFDVESTNSDVSILINNEEFTMDTYLEKNGELNYYFCSDSDLFTIRIQTFHYDENKLLINTYETEIFYKGSLKRLEYNIQDLIDYNSLVKTEIYDN